MRSFRWIVPAALLFAGAVPAAFAQVIIPGIVSSQLAPDLKGLILLEELNCAACHTSEAPFAAQAKKAPRLSAVGSRVNPHYLEAFLRDPHGTKPGTTMPDVLAHLGARERGEIAESLTHFLLSLKKSDFALQPPDAVAARHGEVLFHSRGCAACHSPRDEEGKELLGRTSVPLGALQKKYSVKSLAEFLRRPHASRPSGRMPDLRLQGKDVERITHYLLQDTRVPGPLAYT
ncbi:MAG: c-type cytochrome, partial [Verrucomicrobiota bacterium]|nr:c-type cytochrome [Verrucomicrobiota bacterium]